MQGNKIDILMELFSVSSCANLASILGISRQAVYSARGKNSISKNILATAARKLNITEVELYDKLNGGNNKDIHKILICQLSGHIDRMAIENGKMRVKIERLLKENYTLRAELNKIAPAICAGIASGDMPTVFETLDTDSMVKFVEFTRNMLSQLIEKALRGKVASSSPANAPLLECSTGLDYDTMTALEIAHNFIRKEIMRATILPAGIADTRALPETDK